LNDIAEDRPTVSRLMINTKMKSVKVEIGALGKE
jgi:hypothetical protein